MKAIYTAALHTGSAELRPLNGRVNHTHFVFSNFGGLKKMPRKAKPKKNAKKPRLSENSKAELNKIGDEASSDNLEQCIEDFDTQGDSNKPPCY